MAISDELKKQYGGKNYYQVFGLEDSASEDELNKAYRKLAREYHPDTHPNDPVVEAKMKEVNEASDVLRDQEKRKLYNIWFRQVFPKNREGQIITESEEGQKGTWTGDLRTDMGNWFNGVMSSGRTKPPSSTRPTTPQTFKPHVSSFYPAKKDYTEVFDIARLFLATDDLPEIEKLRFCQRETDLFKALVQYYQNDEVREVSAGNYLPLTHIDSMSSDSEFMAYKISRDSKTGEVSVALRPKALFHRNRTDFGLVPVVVVGENDSHQMHFEDKRTGKKTYYRRAGESDYIKISSQTDSFEPWINVNHQDGLLQTVRWLHDLAKLTVYVREQRQSEKDLISHLRKGIEENKPYSNFLREGHLSDLKQGDFNLLFLGGELDMEIRSKGPEGNRPNPYSTK